MNILALKLLLAPIIIGGASLAGRRWGHAVSGWLIGLPLTSGPVAMIVAYSHGADFALSTVLGTLSGGISLVAFCLSYAWLAARFRWQAAAAGSLGCYFLFTLLMQNIVPPLWLIFALDIAVILLAVKLMPPQTRMEVIEEKPGKWDIPARILIATSFILILTGGAPYIGARLTGLLSTIPLYTVILTVFAQRLQGPAGAASVLRGLLFGLFGFSGFYLVLAVSLEHTGILTAFLLATAATLAIQGGTLFLMRQSRGVFFKEEG